MTAELERRLKLLKAAQGDRYLQVLLRERCRKDPFYWFDNFAYTFDPRINIKGIPRYLPFQLWDRQREYLQWRIAIYTNGDHGVVEKTRDSGMSWVNMAHQYWAWLFEPGFQGGIGSRKQELVDGLGDMKALFPKIRAMIDRTPNWMLPKGFNRDRDDNFCRLLNPETGATITGEAGDAIGRGGRTTFYDWDEVAFTPHFDSIEAALSNNTDTVFYTSTVNGLNGFYGKRSRLPASCVFTFHWRNDPRKDDEWYAEQCAKFDKVTIAQEIDIDYTASVEGIFIPGDYVRAAVEIELPESGELVAGLDVAGEGSNETCLIAGRGPVVYPPIVWKEGNTIQTAHEVRAYGEDRPDLEMVIVDADGIGSEVIANWEHSNFEIPFQYFAFHGGKSASDRVWSGENVTSKEKFRNARAEAWGILYDRFRKTYEYVNELEVYPLDELISIPNDPTLIQQLSQPKRVYTETGKIKVESKEDMKKRGLESPDRADALAYRFAPTNTAIDFVRQMLGR